MTRHAPTPIRHRTRAGSVATVVIGAGHAGLAMSRCLTDRSIDHVVLERGEVANSWRRDRWDSLRLLTPNWQSRLPGHAYHGNAPDDYMTMPEVIEFIDGYSATIRAPVHTHTTVTAVQRTHAGYRVVTDQGTWHCRCVVLASGAFSIPSIPACGAAIPEGIRQITAKDYKRPDPLEDGGVLVVGASATGLQLADEIHRSGRPVTVAVGEHVRIPRTYRGRDIQWWMDRTGLLDERYDEVDDIVRARRVPSPQLVGTGERSTLDLNALTDAGVHLVGRLAGVNDGNAQFSGSLHNVCAMADLKQDRLLKTIDEWAEQTGIVDEVGQPEDFAPTRVGDSPPLGLDLEAGAIRTVVWATGFRPDFGFLQADVFDRKGRIRHDGGVVAAPGLYVMGLSFMRRRKSSFIHGAADDARDLSGHMAAYLGTGATTAAVG